MIWGSHSKKEMIIGQVIFEISPKNDVHNNFETDYKSINTDNTEYSLHRNLKVEDQFRLLAKYIHKTVRTDADRVHYDWLLLMIKYWWVKK